MTLGTWSGKTGPLAPLYENPAVDDDDDMHIDQSVKYVLSECGDKKRLNMGLATYGKAWKGVPKTGTPPGLWQTSSFTQGWQATNDLAETGGSTGTIPWFELYGTLMSRCTRTWDDASQTPTAFCDTNAKGEKDVFISFEDRVALTLPHIHTPAQSRPHSYLVSLGVLECEDEIRSR